MDTRSSFFTGGGGKPKRPGRGKALPAAVAGAALLAAVAGAGWWTLGPSRADEQEAPALPVPPFPPRIAEGDAYESCLSSLSADPVSAITVAEAWQTNGGGDGARHCRGLALIAAGKPDDGAAALEQLGQQSTASASARAQVLGQAAQARLMAGDADRAIEDASQALALSPDDTELLILRASAEGTKEQFQAAVDDLSHALMRDPKRPDALVARAVMRRKLDQLDQAGADVSEALTLDPENADALLERGILRQRAGDTAGARQDWEHAKKADPNSTTADLAEQNLSLLEAGPSKK